MTTSGRASSSTTTTPPPCILDGSTDYDVFLSFRGEDTRKNFTDHLYAALIDKRIRTFRDEEEVRMGESIAPEISKAIKRSRVFIVIFSKNYADSGWCLDEIEQIMECKRSKGRKVYPIFYHVEPAHVRELEEDYGTPFSKYEENADKEKREKIERRRAALREAGNLGGIHVTDQFESVVIKRVIEAISDELMPKPFNMGNLVVNESILKDLIEFINNQPEDVRMIGIYGIDGIGKTTIAQAICNEISCQFEGVSFLANIRKVSKEYFGLYHLQEQLLCDILVPRGNREIIFYRRNNVIKEKICHKKVLIVLDDVNDLKQLQFLAGECNWFGKGSRIIITSIHKEMLRRHGVELYELKKLEYHEGLSLLTQHAIDKRQPRSRCNIFDLSRRAIEYCCGLPLALKVLGSYLRRKTPGQWKSTLEVLEEHLGEFDNEILDHALRISFERLSCNEQNIFFDVACFFNGEHENFVTKILYGCGFSPKNGLKVLSDRCLLTISDQKLWMHNSIQELGWEMVREETSIKGERSRLWDHDDVRYVLKNKKGTNKIGGMFVDLSESDKLNFTNDAFGRMTELRVLKVFLGCKNVCEENCKKFFSGNLELSVSDLVYLHWHGYPSDSFPSNFQEADVLLELHMPYSSLKHLEGNEGCFPMLTVLDLSHSRNLEKISNFSTMPKLEKLILEGCASLLEIDSSIGDLDKLTFLNLNGCKNLDSLPSSFGKLKSRETLTVSGCFRPEKMPVDLGGLQISENSIANRTAMSLRELDLSECHLSDGAIPSSFWCLSSLLRLNLSGNDFTVIPEGISQLGELEVLQLGYCKRLLEIPNNLPPTVQEVDAHCCSSLIPSSNFRDATTLLRRIQNLAPKTEFCILLPGSEIPDWFRHRNMGYSVTIERLPPEWDQANFLGFAVCFVFASEHEIPEHTPVVSCKINDFRFCYTYSCGRGENVFVESDHVWLAYQPHAQVEKFHHWTQIKASFEVFGIGTHNRVKVLKECAINLIYADR